MSKITLFVCLVLSLQAKAQVITTIIGTGTAGFSGDGGPGIDAEINQVNAIYASPDGLVYLSDAYNQRIRELKDYGIIFTIAGNGTGAYSGDSILATTAELHQPGGAVADAMGNVYIGDYYNQRIRKIDHATGIISTIAGTGVAGYSGDGGPATAAQFYNPYNVTLDTSGNLYIADQYNQRVRKIALATGIITTVAGTGAAGSTGDGGPATAAEIFNPNYVHSDGSGNLYITDNGNHKIRKINTAGIISVVAGTGTGGYSGDGGPATAAELHFPAGINLDTSGNLYIADYANNVVRKINTAGIISTVAGNHIAGYSGDGGLATLAELNGPLDVTTDHLGNLYICDDMNYRIRKVTPAPTAALSASGITVCSDSCLTFVSQSTGFIDSIRWAAPGAGGTISNPVSDTTSVCFTTPGSSNIYLYAYGPGGVDTSSIAITINNCTTGVVNVNTTECLKLFPNPNDGTFSVNVPVPGNAALTITDITGQILLTHQWENSGNTDETILLSPSLPGVYFVKISCGSHSYYNKLMIW